MASTYQAASDKFVKLTSKEYDELYIKFVNSSHIVCIEPEYFDGDHLGTYVTISNGARLYVKETPEAIFSMLA